MHQTFYIDIDEEITSVVEKMRKARAKEIVMVVPRRALLIQSIVNLRILKNEADSLGLQLMIITQDKLGKMLIEKAGILVQQKMDNIAGEEIEIQDESGQNFSGLVPAENPPRVLNENKGRLDEIGSKDYFDSSMVKKTPKAFSDNNGFIQNRTEGQEQENEEKITNKELVSGVACDIIKKPAQKISQPTFDSTHQVNLSKQDYQDQGSGFPVLNSQDKKPGFSALNSQDKKIESFFQQKNYLERRAEKSNCKERRMESKKEDFGNYSLPSKTHGLFWIFGLIFVLAIAFVSVYVFVPRAEIDIFVKNDTQNIDSSVTGDIGAMDIDYEGGIIPAKIVSIETSVTKSLESTGEKSVSNQKARGRVIIYNAYSSSPQPLVATTRLLTEDGKLFRLVKGVTVPGMSGSDPGSVEAEVAADQAGEGYNIGPASFKIPGFESSGEKYEKFYAKSEASMSGGGDGAGFEKIVTADDLNGAKDKVTAEISEAIQQKAKEQIGDNALLVPGSVSMGETSYQFSNAAGDVANSFQVTAQVVARAFAVDQGNLNDLVSKMIVKTKQIDTGIENESLVFDFSKPNIDFENGKVEIKFHAVGNIVSSLNLEDIKAQILGKREGDLSAYLSTFSEIEKAEVTYWPSFMNGRIPLRSGQVTLGLDK